MCPEEQLDQLESSPAQASCIQHAAVLKILQKADFNFRHPSHKACCSLCRRKKWAPCHGGKRTPMADFFVGTLTCRHDVLHGLGCTTSSSDARALLSSCSSHWPPEHLGVRDKTNLFDHALPRNAPRRPPESSCRPLCSPSLCSPSVSCF